MQYLEAVTCFLFDCENSQEIGHHGQNKIKVEYGRSDFLGMFRGEKINKFGDIFGVI